MEIKKHYKLYKGNMLDMLDNIKENSVDAVITDPPYEIVSYGENILEREKYWIQKYYKENPSLSLNIMQTKNVE